MKVSYNWLKDYCKHSLSIKELCEALTNVGLVVDEATPVGDDYCMEMEVTSNRPDCLGMIGVAREVAAIVRGGLVIPDVQYETIDEDINGITSVTIEDEELCRRYTARIIKNVNVGPSPEWLQERIKTIGLRPVNNIVDITNFVLMECGQPLHAFDFDKLEGRRIIVRRAVNGEKMEAIDGTQCTLSPDLLMIADSKNPVAIAGIMGGKDSEVSGSTTNILLESAFFEPRNVRRSSRKLGIFSDSSYRFERRVGPECVDWASRRAAKLFQELAGGRIVEGVIDKNSLKAKDSNVTLRLPRLNSLLGIHVEKDVAKDILERLQFKTISETETSLNVSVPAFRADVYREIDLIEEISRIHGYDKIPTKCNVGIKITRESKYDIVVEKVKNIMSGLGFNEIVTDSIVDSSHNQYDGLWSKNSSLKISNPLRSGEDLLRKTLILNLLKVKKHNQNYGTDITQLYELSRIFLPSGNGEMPEEKECLCILRDKKDGGHNDDTFRSLKGAIESILKHLRINHTLEISPCESDLFNPGKSATLKLKNKVFGYIGELSKGAAKGYDFKTTPCITELDFNLLVTMSNLKNTFQKLPSFPTMARDLAIVSNENVTWTDIKGCIESQKTDYLNDIEFFDIYRGKQIEKGKKSTAFKLIFQAADRTLKSEEVDVLQEGILKNLNDKLGAVLRS